jgi:spore maturation protein CgeB
MRILLITTNYPNWTKYVYQNNPALHKQSYSEQLRFLVNQHFSSFSSFYTYWKGLGHETCLVLPDIESLQTKWNEENNFPTDRNWEYETALNQVKDFKPDIIFAGCQNNYMGDFYGKLKEVTGKKVVVWFSSPIRPSHNFSNIDHVISSSDQFVRTFNSMGIGSSFLKAGFDPNVLNQINKNKNFTDNVSFVGSLSGHHSKRDTLLRNLKKENIDFSLYGNGLNKSFVDRLKDLYNAKSNKFAYLKNAFFISPYASNFKKEVFGLDMYQTLQNSKIVINSHIDAANGMVGNMRMYETSGVGSCLVNDNGYNIKDILEPDYEVVVYNSAEEASEKINWLLEHENERKKIAIAGQKRTLKDHNYKDRAMELESILKKLL